MIKPAIVAVGYDRPHLMKRLLESIGRAHFEYDDIPLIISIDQSDKSDEVEKVAREFNWEHGTKEIRRYPERQGLRKHIVHCGDYSEKYGAVIILEDDLIVSEDFYSYVSQAHEYYQADERICGVSLYTFQCNQFTRQRFMPVNTPYDVYLGGMVVTWGQSWTGEQWGKFKAWYFEHEDKLPTVNHAIPEEISGWTRSWGRYFVSYMAEKGLSYVYPYVARSTCFADIGEHSVGKLPITCMQVALMQGRKDYSFAEYEKLARYDSFYERVIDDETQINQIPAKEVCFDLNNTKQCVLGKRYIVTNEELPYKKLASYAMVLRPIEMNVLLEVPGEEIHLYQLEKCDEVIRKPKKRPYIYKLSMKRLKYDHYDISWRTAFFYGIKDIKDRLKAKLK